jgi:hypothetical protein
MTADHTCPNCGAPVPLPLLLCPTCRASGWDDGSHHLSGDELALYLEVRRGERRAPAGWWRGEAGLERGAALLCWYAQRELSTTTRDSVQAVASLRTIAQVRLHGWFVSRERSLSVHEAFDLAFPELMLRPWELPGQVPRGYWEQGGDEARADAVRWWLGRLGLSAQEVLAQAESRTHSIERQLQEAGLGNLTHDRGLRALLHLVEPAIAPEPPPSGRGQRREEATVACPRCGRRFRSLGPHLVQAHPELSREEREALLASHAHLSPATLARYEAVGRTPLNDEVRWRKVGLAFPIDWWPTDAPGAALALLDGPDGPMLQLTPADAHGQRRLHRNRRSWELRMPQPVRDQIAGVPVVQAEGRVLLGPLSEEGATAVKGWLDRGKTEEA